MTYVELVERIQATLSNGLGDMPVQPAAAKSVNLTEFVTYRRIRGEAENLFKEISNYRRITIEFACHAPTYLRSVQIEDDVFNVLNNSELNLNFINEEDTVYSFSGTEFIHVARMRFNITLQ